MQQILQSNPRLELADQYIRFTNTNVFLTGKAGTGKTTFLKNIKKHSPKRMVIVAPTGVAAINAGGVTIHSFFQLSFGPNLPDQAAENKPFTRKFSGDKIKAIKAIDLLVIDEISMVRADVLDAIDEVLRKYRNRNKPFGGVQLLMIGDLHQLAPVIKDEEWLILKPYYPSVYFFESKALNMSQFITIELTHIFRQDDEIFIGLLNKIRDKKLDAEGVKLLNSRYQPDFEPTKGDDYITLTSHNNAALTINQAKLKALIGQTFTFSAETTGDFPESMYPNELELQLKVGAQVMFVKNDLNKEKRYFNGKLGEITGIGNQIIHVRCKDEPEDIAVTKVIWENIKYVLDENKVMQEEVIGTFNQYPIKAAWAITIHKSQGLTFERAIIDAASSFAHGQVYVALSRCKTFDGLVLSTPISNDSVKSDQTINAFDQEADKQDLSETTLNEAKKLTQADWIRDLFDYKALKYSLANIYKEIEPNHKQLKINTLQLVSAIINEYNLEIGTIIDKFQYPLETLLAQAELPEENTILQERIKKGSEYLHPKLDLLIYKALHNLDLECDNKETKKDISKALEQCLRNVFEKLTLLKICTNGFNSTQYLQTKANAAIDFEVEITKRNKSANTNPQNTKERQNDLYSQIKHWRDATALEKNIEKYMVLPQKTIQNLVEELPGNKAALAKISGLGKVKVEQYGSEILDIINEFCEENGITPNQKGGNKAKPKSIEKGSTFELTLNLFNEGKTVEEIAKMRQLAVGTVESHLSRIVAQGNLPIEKVMDMKKVMQIKDFIQENPTTISTEIIMALGDTFTYDDIRLVKGWMLLEG
jgi:PIF1-like helicase/Helix-turn-helix domain/HRDC domain/Helicase